MQLLELLTTIVGVIVALVLIHVAVYYVVRTLYPPTAPTPIVTFVEPPREPPPAFTELPSYDQQQTVNVPTLEEPVRLEAANSQGNTGSTVLQDPTV